MESRRKRVEDHENQLQTLRVQDAEEYNMVKIKLETDVQVGFLLFELHKHEELEVGSSC